MAQALRNAGFMLPGALGVQEGALIGAAALVGVPPAPALTVALVRRTREVLMTHAPGCWPGSARRPRRRATELPAASASAGSLAATGSARPPPAACSAQRGSSASGAMPKCRH